MRTTDYDVRPAGVAELVDAADLNSAGRKAVRVRISAPVPRSASKRHLWRSGTLTFVLWQDFDAMTAIIGPNWREPSWLPGLGEAIESSSLEILETVVSSYEKLAQTPGESTA